MFGAIKVLSNLKRAARNLEHTLNFEPLQGGYNGERIDNLILLRAKIPGGWLVTFGESLQFVPDPEHKWNGGSLDTGTQGNID